MPEEIQNNTATLPSQPVQNNSADIAREQGDAELDGALNKLFNKTPVVEEKALNNVQPEQTNEPSKEKPNEIKNKPDDKQSKAEATDAPLLDPDTVDESASKRQQGWTSLKNNLKRAHKIIEDVKQENSKIKASLSERGEATSKEVEDLKKQVQELSAFRAMVDIQADPEFVNKYDAPIEKNISGIKEMLKGMEVSDAIVDKIDFSNTKLMEDIINHVGEHKDKFTARKLERKVQDLLDLSEKRDETIIEHKSKHKEYLENKKKESFTKGAETEGRIIKRLESVAKNIPFLNKMAPKEGASEAEMAQVDLHNTMVEGMTQKVNQVLKMETPEDKAEIAVAAVASHYLSSQLKAANSRIASLENELKKISNVSSETERTKPTVSRRSSNGNGQIVDVDTALNDFMTRSR